VVGDRPVTTPWRETIRLGEVGRPTSSGPVERRLAPDEKTRKALAKFLDLESLEALEATVRLTPWFDGAQLNGRWSAAFTQLCGVTLEPLDRTLSGDFTVHVVPANSKHAPTELEPEVVLDPEGDDPPDVLEDETIDLAGYVIEHFVLDIDPFPRAPGAEFKPPDPDPEASPFAKLAGWKGGKSQS